MYRLSTCYSYLLGNLHVSVTNNFNISQSHFYLDEKLFLNRCDINNFIFNIGKL